MFCCTCTNQNTRKLKETSHPSQPAPQKLFHSVHHSLHAWHIMHSNHHPAVNTWKGIRAAYLHRCSSNTEQKGTITYSMLQDCHYPYIHTHTYLFIYIYIYTNNGTSAGAADSNEIFHIHWPWFSTKNI